MNLINLSAVCLDSSLRKIKIDGFSRMTVLGLSFVQQCCSHCFCLFWFASLILYFAFWLVQQNLDM